MNLHRSLLASIVFSLVVLVYIWNLWPDDFTHLVMCDVGQGDGILISRGFTQVLIDGGPDQKVMECLKKKIPFWDRRIELVVLTHPHKDHYEGLKSVFEVYRVGILVQAETNENAADFEQFQQLVSSKKSIGLKTESPQVGHRYVFGRSDSCEVLSPQVDLKNKSTSSEGVTETRLSAVETEKAAKQNNINDESVALLCAFGSIKVGLTGDLEIAGESALVTHGLISDIDILKVGHHGSKSSSIQPFLAITRPEIALISSGKNNRYGHPHDQAIANLVEVNAQVLRTDQEGTIEYVSDGERYWRR